MRIVPIALSKYFFEGIPVEETIRNHRDIYDFCLMLKLNSKFKGEMRSLTDKIELKRTTRYYISNKGYSIIKIDTTTPCSPKAPTPSKCKETGVNVGFVGTYFNNYEEKSWEEYNINYQFYILECKKIINVIEDKQLKLFDFNSMI